MTKPMVLLPALTILLLTCSWAAAQDAPTVDQLAGLPTGAAVSAAAKKTVADYIDHWLDVLTKANAATTVIGARKMLDQGYTVLPSTSLKYEYAKHYAAKVAAALNLAGDPLKVIKETSAAMVAARMEQITIQPALDLMAAHANPAVRYWAAKGFRTAGPQLLAQEPYAGKMLATLDKTGAAETSGPVAAAVLHAASGYRDVSGDSATKLRAVLAKVWLARCQEVYQGNLEMIAAIQKASTRLTRATQAAEKTALQVLIDAMEAASLGLVKAAARQDEDVCEALGELLRGLEDRLAKTAGLSERAVGAALKSQGGWGLKAARIRLAVNKLKAWLAANRAIKPRFKPAAPRTQPTTKSAG